MQIPVARCNVPSLLPNATPKKCVMANRLRETAQRSLRKGTPSKMQNPIARCNGPSMFPKATPKHEGDGKQLALNSAENHVAEKHKARCKCPWRAATRQIFFPKRDTEKGRDGANSLRKTAQRSLRKGTPSKMPIPFARCNGPSIFQRRNQNTRVMANSLR